MRIRSLWLLRLAALGLTTVLRMLFATLRVQTVPSRPGVSPYEPTGDERFLYCIWHDGVAGVIFSGRCVNVAGLVSQHHDGEFVAAAMSYLGIRPIRGSSQRGGAEALREMLAATDDWHIAVATDGPRGPRRTVKKGILFLAAHTGRPIVPIAFVAENAWYPRGRWTDMVLPKPFSKVRLYGGEPIVIPQGTEANALEPYRIQVQAAMDRLHAEVETVRRVTFADGRKIRCDAGTTAPPMPGASQTDPAPNGKTLPPCTK